MNFSNSKLDSIIGSSIRLISVWGDMGVGKTTFALQIAANIAKIGNNGLFLYSKPDFPLNKIANILGDNPSEILDKISFIYASDFFILRKLVFNFEFLLLDNLNNKGSLFKFLIIDSLTDLYRIELDKRRKKRNINLNYQLNQILATLYYIADIYNIQILLTNEISRININNEIKEVQTGYKVMDYWILCDIKIERTETLNKRKLIINLRDKKQKYEIFSILTQQGFDYLIS
jgi:RecA/RadA recombinase